MILSLSVIELDVLPQSSAARRAGICFYGQRRETCKREEKVTGTAARSPPVNSGRFYTPSCLRKILSSAGARDSQPAPRRHGNAQLSPPSAHDGTYNRVQCECFTEDQLKQENKDEPQSQHEHPQERRSTL
ncbi:hypothetical protein MHYP_G00193090 [Metynnis hypsauchen]